tara:strand:- start:364 stop:564 length:201 start_codon:yes stop_codon:yes gene_type:complete
MNEIRSGFFTGQSKTVCGSCGKKLHNNFWDAIHFVAQAIVPCDAHQRDDELRRRPKSCFDKGFKKW